MNQVVDKAVLAVSHGGSPGFIAVKNKQLITKVKLITDNNKELIVDVPSNLQKKALTTMINNYDVVTLFKDENLSFYKEKPISTTVVLNVIDVLSMRGEYYIGNMTFDNLATSLEEDDQAEIIWRAEKVWDNKIFRRGDEVEHSERIYALPHSDAGWEIYIPQPAGLKEDDFIFRRRLASIIEETVSRLESGKPVDFPTKHHLTNLIVRKPHSVNLPYVKGLPDDIY